MTTTTNISLNSAVQSSIEDLLRLRPDRSISGFAPAGKVSTEQFGLNKSMFRGRGMEFDETRIYQPGDDIRSIDWRVTARTGKVHSKLFQEERERKVFLLVDCRQMMHFGTQVRFKSVAAAQIASLLSWVAIDGGDCIGGCVIDQFHAHNFPATRNYSSMLRFLKSISEATITKSPPVQTSPNLNKSLRQIRRYSHSGALIFIISDFHDFNADLEREILLISQHANITNIMIHDQLDRLLPTGNDFRVSDGNGVLSLQDLNNKNVEEYKSAFETKYRNLERLARHKRIGFMDMATNADPKSLLSKYQAKTRSQNTLSKVA